MSTKPYSLGARNGYGAFSILRNGETFITTHATDAAQQIAQQIVGALNAQEEGASCIDGEHRATIDRFLAYYNDPSSPGECQKMADAVRALIGGLAAATMHAKHTSDRLLKGDLRTYEVAALTNAAIRALPLLVRLGDFIGNGPVNPDNSSSLGERCDVIGSLRNALEAIGVAPGAMAPTRDGDTGAVQLAVYSTSDGATWRLMRDAGEHCYIESISRRSAERGLSWAFAAELTLPVDASWSEAYATLERVAEGRPARADFRSEGVS